MRPALTDLVEEIRISVVSYWHSGIFCERPDLSCVGSPLGVLEVQFIKLSFVGTQCRHDGINTVEKLAGGGGVGYGHWDMITLFALFPLFRSSDLLAC